MPTMQPSSPSLLFTSPWPCPPSADLMLTLPQKREFLCHYSYASNLLKLLAQQARFGPNTRFTPKVVGMASPMHATRLKCEKALATYLSDCLKKGIPWPAPLPSMNPHFHDAPTPMLSALRRCLSTPVELTQPPSPPSPSAMVS
ncbi:hypothetical protein L0F63_004341 [Massospora cicadina]|nr:hypothetical protein L0F63_004341 [Massospora cicadina]